jgi:hypothetical protein
VKARKKPECSDANQIEQVVLGEHGWYRDLSWCGFELAGGESVSSYGTRERFEETPPTRRKRST